MATDSSSTDIAQTSLDAMLAEPLHTFQQIVGYLDRHKVASLVLLTIFYPFIGRSVAAASTTSPTGSCDLALVGLLGLIAVHQSTHFSWQARFAYLQWKSLSATFEKILGGSVLALALFVALVSPLPISSLCLVSMVAWQYVVVTYHKGIRQIAADGDQALSQVRVVVENARAYASRVTELEDSVLAVAKTICADTGKYNVDLFRHVPDACSLFTENIDNIVPSATELTGLATTSSTDLSTVLRAFENVQWVVARANLFAQHGEMGEAELLLKSTAKELTSILEAEGRLLDAKTRAHEIAVKIHLEDMVDIHKRILKQLEAPPVEPAPPAVAPEPERQPLVDNVVLKNSIALAGSTYGAERKVDDEPFELTLPFAVQVYGYATTVLSINDNGMICLDNAPDDVQARRDGQVLPSREGLPGYALFPLWTDLLIEEGKPHGIYYEIQGNAPNRSLHVEWYVGRYNVPNQYFHFLVTLDEARPNIVTFKYYDVQDEGAKGTVGVQGPNSHYMFSYNQPKVKVGLQLVFDTTPGVNALEESMFPLPGN